MGASGQAKRKNEAFTGHKPVDIDISNKVRKSICMFPLVSNGDIKPKK